MKVPRELYPGFYVVTTLSDQRVLLIESVLAGRPVLLSGAFLANARRRLKRGHAPDRFRASHRKRKRNEALLQQRQWFRVLASQGHLALYGYQAQHLGLSTACGKAEGYFDAGVIQSWKAAVTRIHPLHRAQLHISDNGVLHVHVIAPHNPAALGYCKPVTKTLECVASYFDNQPLPIHSDFEGLFLFHQYRAKAQGKRLPQTAWFIPHYRSRAFRDLKSTLSHRH